MRLSTILSTLGVSRWPSALRAATLDGCLLGGTLQVDDIRGIGGVEGNPEKDEATTALPELPKAKAQPGTCTEYAIVIQVVVVYLTIDR